MKQLCVAALALASASLLASSAAMAQIDHTPAPDRAGVDFGIRLGYAIPFGSLDADRGSLAGWVSGAVPVLLEANYRFNHRFSVGPYFQYAFAQVRQDSNTGCVSVNGCTGWVVRAGMQGLYHPDVRSIVAPWVGLGLGYEWTTYSGAVGNVGFAGNAGGWEFVNVQVGAEVLTAPAFRMGPFIGFSIARYDTESGRLGNLTSSSDVTNPALHEWLQVGLRFTFSL